MRQASWFTIQAAADAHQRDASARLQAPRFRRLRKHGGNRGGAHVAELGVDREHLLHVEAEQLHELHRVHRAHLVNHEFVERLGLPAKHIARPREGALRDVETRKQEGTRVGHHAVDLTMTELSVLRRRHGNGAHHAMTFRVAIGATKNHRHSARSERQRREVVAKGLHVTVGILEALERLFDDEARALAVDDEAVVELPSLDHVADDVDAIEERETRVSEIEVSARLGEAEIAVHDARRGRLDVVAANRGVHEHADSRSIDAGGLEGTLGSHRRGIARHDAFVPESSGLNARERGEQIRTNAEPLRRLGEALLNLGRRNAMGGIDVRKADDGHVGKRHEKSPRAGAEWRRSRTKGQAPCTWLTKG